MKSSESRSYPVIDLFAGPGGLGEGFSSFKTKTGDHFDVLLSIEKDTIARETLKLRSFFRKLPADLRPTYYETLKAASPLSLLYQTHGDIAEQADAEAWCMELGEENAEAVHEKIACKLAGAKDWVLIGGPPCQAYSLVGRSRNRGIVDYKPEDDVRHVLYREYLEVIARHRPAVFVMENVKGLLSSKLDGSRIFEQILKDLRNPIESLKYRTSKITECPSYNLYSLNSTNGIAANPNDYILRMEEFGIPQARHRVIILGVREDINYVHEPLVQGSLTARDVLKDLPKLRSGISKGIDSDSEWTALLNSIINLPWYKDLATSMPEVHRLIATTITNLKPSRYGRGAEFIARKVSRNPSVLADWYVDENIGGYYNHSTRSHIQSDLHRYLFASSFAEATGRSPKLSEYPSGLLPNHKNATAAIFEDRFRVQTSNRPSTTITSHISKDGHYYIHYDPTQCRSLTVREAARLQTFPDNYYFCGPRTEQYRQVGNAVPPLLARQIAKVVARILRNGSH